MPLIPLRQHRVTKVWGRRDLPAAFGAVAEGEEPVGEIWFDRPDGEDDQLLVKYLLTSERLSIQSHPDDAAARAAGLPRGKDEAWLILSAEPDARIGLGPRREVDRDTLRQAAQDGSIVDLIDWWPVRPGQLIYSPAGTIHALGAGLTLIEIQQNCDVTYRLYDYGRPRELHLEQGLAAAETEPFTWDSKAIELSPGRTVEAAGKAFVVERWRGLGAVLVRPEPGRPLWLVPVVDGGILDGRSLAAGTVFLLDEGAQLELPDGSELLVAYPGGNFVPGLVEPS